MKAVVRELHFDEVVSYIPKKGSITDRSAISHFSCVLVDDNINDVAVVELKEAVNRMNAHNVYAVRTELDKFKLKKHWNLYKNECGNLCKCRCDRFRKQKVVEVQKNENWMAVPKMYERYVNNRETAVVLNWMIGTTAIGTICFPAEDISTWWEKLYYSRCVGIRGSLPVVSYDLNDMIVSNGIVMDLFPILEKKADVGTRYKIDYSMVKDDHKEFWDKVYENEPDEVRRVFESGIDKLSAERHQHWLRRIDEFNDEMTKKYNSY